MSLSFEVTRKVCKVAGKWTLRAKLLSPGGSRDFSPVNFFEPVHVHLNIPLRTPTYIFFDNLKAHIFSLVCSSPLRLVMANRSFAKSALSSTTWLYVRCTLAMWWPNLILQVESCLASHITKHDSPNRVFVCLTSYSITVSAILHVHVLHTSTISLLLHAFMSTKTGWLIMWGMIYKSWQVTFLSKMQVYMYTCTHCVMKLTVNSPI